MAMKERSGRMILVLDIGNTRTNVGLFENERILGHWRLSSLGTRTGDEYWVYLKDFLTGTGVESIDGVVIGSVVPRLTRTYAVLSRERLDCEPLLVSGTLDLGIRLRVDRPEEVGADRIANSVAASVIWQRDVIVVDLGTATTFDVVSAEKEYLGGVIAPGIETSAARLFEKTAKLPQVGFLVAKSVIGRNTEDAIRSGLYFGAIGQIDGIVRRICEEWERSPLVIATGGLAEMASSSSETIAEIDPFLTLKGLQLCDSIMMERGQT